MQTRKNQYKFNIKVTQLTQHTQNTCYMLLTQQQVPRERVANAPRNTAAFISFDCHTNVRFFTIYLLAFLTFTFSKLMFQLNDIAPLNSSYIVQRTEVLILPCFMNKLLNKMVTKTSCTAQAFAPPPLTPE
jgi:hypothetical protein